MEFYQFQPQIAKLVYCNFLQEEDAAVCYYSASLSKYFRVFCQQLPTSKIFLFLSSPSLINQWRWEYDNTTIQKIKQNFSSQFLYQKTFWPCSASIPLTILFRNSESSVNQAQIERRISIRAWLLESISRELFSYPYRREQCDGFARIKYPVFQLYILVQFVDLIIYHVLMFSEVNTEVCLPPRNPFRYWYILYDSLIFQLVDFLTCRWPFLLIHSFYMV